MLVKHYHKYLPRNKIHTLIYGREIRLNNAGVLLQPEPQQAISSKVFYSVTTWQTCVKSIKC